MHSALAKKAAIEMVPLDLNKEASQVMMLVRRELVSHEVSLRMELDPNLPRIFGDRVQLQQVIINLVTNGIEAMHALTDRPRELVIRTGQEELNRVFLAVTDCGAGIAAENIDAIFNPFFTTKSSGMGMGLSICRSIVKLMKDDCLLPAMTGLAPLFNLSYRLTKRTRATVVHDLECDRISSLVEVSERSLLPMASHIGRNIPNNGRSWRHRLWLAQE